MIVNALTAGVGLSRQGGFGKSKQVKEIKDINIPNKTTTVEGKVTPIEGTASFKVKGEQLKDINSPDKFKQLIVDQAKSNGDTQVTLENVGERYDLSKFIDKSGKKWTPSWNPKTWFKTSSKESVEFKAEKNGQTEPAETALGR